jgi:hypothetical protein
MALLIYLYPILQAPVILRGNTMVEALESISWGSFGAPTMSHNVEALSEGEGPEPAITVL